MIKRNTVQRTLVLETVRSVTDHPTADEIYERILPRCPGISKATVYRNLNELASEGKILRVAVANAPDRFDLTAHSHCHCRCNLCGRVFDYTPAREPEFDDSLNNGFRVTGCDLIVHGICGECQKIRPEV